MRRMKAEIANFQKNLHADVRNKPHNYDYIGTQNKFFYLKPNIKGLDNKKSPAFQAPDFLSHLVLPDVNYVKTVFQAAVFLLIN